MKVRFSPNTSLYRAKALSVIDGNTLDVQLDFGVMGITAQARLQLQGVEAPDRTVEDYSAMGAALTEWLTAAEAGGEYLVVDVHKEDGFGRLVSTVYNAQGETANGFMSELRPVEEDSK